ncbi:deoxyhypusine synthase [Vairimorpha apis BRL 01]|uniref:deoxyhypusine synthase n=1 Tax=Vairimorpha apis BRL 01 TaxID=1037528 RepID=T0LC07_9MICR|nr:deoxyhypusine synthase [Vairimorpha apis BRL 01]
MKIPHSVSDLTAENSFESKFNFNTPVKGLDFNNNDITLDTIIESFSTTGFQSINLHKSISEINKMIETKAKIYLGCTSNLISSGLRDIIRYLVEHKFVHVCVITAGGIEEDIIKCLKPTYCANFNIKGAELRNDGLNRVGNLVIPNENYVLFEKWMNEILDELVQDKQIIMTPSQFIKYLGMKINNKESILYWAYINNITIYSPAITDGSIGDMLTFYKKRENLKLDIVEDIKNINFSGISTKYTGAIILGSGLIKHHILNANLFRNGLDRCVLINTANEYDGSDSGASLEESISWGKVKPNTECVKVFGDATILFPLIVYSTFYKLKKV